MNIMVNMEFLVIVITVTIQCVLSIQMEWGENPDLVKESDRIQGREHIKQLVLLEGESIDLECQVLFTSRPVNDIRWRVDGKQIYPPGNSSVVTKDGDVFIENHYKIDNISKTMDASSVNCEYEKGSFVGRLEACLNVFKLEIETSKKDYKTCKLIFKESTRRSQDEANVNRRIKAKIVDLTNLLLDEITVQNDGYSVIMSLDDTKNNKAILAMQPKYTMDGNVIDSLDQCECDNDESQSDVIIGISVVTGILVVILIVVGPKLKTRIFRRNCGSDDLDQPGFRACEKKRCELCPHATKASGGKKVVTEVAIHQTGVKKCFSEGTMKIELKITCTDTHILYVLTCTKKKCMKQNKQYIGETKKSGVDMLRELEIECKNTETHSPVGQHFQSKGHSKNDMEFVVVQIDRIHTDRNDKRRDLVKRYSIKDNMNEPEEITEMQFLV